MAGSIFLAMRARIASLQKNRADQYNQEIVDLMENVRASSDREKLDEAENRLFKMFEQVIQDIDKDRITADSLGSFTLSWNQAIETVRHRRIVIGART
jgi:GTP cyclohydrolase I